MNKKYKYLSILAFILTFTIFSCGESVKPLNELDKHRTAKNLYNKILSHQKQNFIPYSQLIDSMNEGQVIFIGEQHDSQRAHEYQLKILKSLYQKDQKIAIAFEMFDRDVQTIINQYLDGKISEKQFLKKSRPWSNYKKDYKPLIEFAKKHRLKVIAANAPFSVRKKIIHKGEKWKKALSDKEKSHIAQSIDFKDKQYKKYFYNSIPKKHPGIEKFLKKFYIASVVKDETMGESITNFLATPENSDYIVLVINGKFHSDYGLAIPKSVLKRMKVSIKIITILPFKASSKVKLKALLKKKIADYLIFTDYKKSYTMKFRMKKKK